MKILALEFSSARRGVAIVKGRDVLGLAEATGITPGPFELVESALQMAGMEREQIECVAVGLGPGSYTGVRSSIALAQGWQLALGVKLLGISSADVLAATAQKTGLNGRIAVVVDALRGEFYSATYALSSAEWREVTPLRLLTYEAVEAMAKCGELLISPDAKCPFGGAKLIMPSAGELGQVASRRDDFVPGERLEPIYLRETNFVKAPPPKFY